MNPPDRKEVVWLPFWFGCWAGLGPWVLIGLYFFGGDQTTTPNFVYAILLGYLIFFNTFPINMVLQYAKIGR